MVLQKDAWDAAPTEFVIIDSDTNIPNRVLWSQKRGHMGIHGRVHQVKSREKVYEYYYPGILDYLLHVDFRGVNFAYLMPSLHAEIFEQWLVDNRLRALRLRGVPVGLNQERLEHREEMELFRYLDYHGHEQINRIRWNIDSDLSAIDVLKNDEDIFLKQHVLANTWKIDWTPGKKVTWELIVKHGVDLDSKMIRSTDSFKMNWLDP